MTRFSTVVSILIITLVSCGDTGMFLPSLGEDGDIAVQTVADGTVIGPDGSIGITFQVGPQGTNPDRVVVTVSDRGGRAVLSRTVVAGEIDVVVESFLAGTLPTPALSMPGCCGRQHQFRRGRGQRGRRGDRRGRRDRL